MNNSNTIGYEEGLTQVKAMFPGFDEEIIFAILYENQMNIEPTIETLISMQGDSIPQPSSSTENIEKEISLFNNLELAGGGQKKSFKHEPDPLSEGPYFPKKKIKKVSTEYDYDIYGPSKSNKENAKPQSQKSLNEKKTFKQKFSNWVNNIFKKKSEKNASPRKNEEYRELDQDDYQ